ncbi:MAG: hypothetical protein EZS28_038199, partial [Streblomastix strix]
NYDLTVTFRPLSNPKVCPTTWLNSWFGLRREEDRDKPLWWRPKNKKHPGQRKGIQLLQYTNLQSSKSIDQGATIQEINRASRHKDGSSTVAVHYDMNLNDTVRDRLTNFE